jgi:hypothetical protein
MNINFFDIPSFDRAFILARKSNKTLPGSVRDNLSDKEEERLLEIIEGFEKDPTDLAAKKKNYDELMKLFYKGIGLDEKGKGTITKENQRAAFELSALMGDAILQDQQNIRKTYSSDDELKKVLELQNQFRKDLEKTDFEKLLKAKGSSYTELSEGQKEYQTEKITSYLAENKKDFTDIFEKLSEGKNLNEDQQRKLKNLTKLSGTGINGQKILNDILHTFKEFKDYSFTNVNLTKMKEAPGELLEQAVPENINPNDNWERIESNKDSDDGSSYVDDSDRSCRSGRESHETSRILKKILAKLEERDTEPDTEYKRPSTPGWLGAIHAGLGIAGQFLNITGLGNRNGCYSPAPCYGGGYPNPCPPSPYLPRPCPPMPYYVGGNTWTWGGTINAPNNSMPSSVLSNPYSTASAYNPVNVNVRVNPVFNNNPYMVSNSSALSSSNSYNLRRAYGIS